MYRKSGIRSILIQFQKTQKKGYINSASSTLVFGIQSKHFRTSKVSQSFVFFHTLRFLSFTNYLSFQHFHPQATSKAKNPRLFNIMLALRVTTGSTLCFSFKQPIGNKVKQRVSFLWDELIFCHSFCRKKQNQRQKTI